MPYYFADRQYVYCQTAGCVNEEGETSWAWLDRLYTKPTCKFCNQKWPLWADTLRVHGRLPKRIQTQPSEGAGKGSVQDVRLADPHFTGTVRRFDGTGRARGSGHRSSSVESPKRACEHALQDANLNTENRESILALRAKLQPQQKVELDDKAKFNAIARKRDKQLNLISTLEERILYINGQVALLEAEKLECANQLTEAQEKYTEIKEEYDAFEKGMMTKAPASAAAAESTGVSPFFTRCFFFSRQVVSL